VTDSLAADFDPAYEDPVPIRPRQGDLDLSEYREIGKVPWEKRMERIRADFPYIDRFDWDRAFDRDVDLFGRVVRDILKLGQATPGRPGPRPGLDIHKAEKQVRSLFGDDHSVEPFPVALRNLDPRASVRQIARRAQIERTQLHRVLTGDKEPDAYTMRACAYAYDKHPSYFAEWRTFYLTCALVRRLEANPDASIALYQQFDRQWKDANQ
jgi:transcriptional regulator with XRE-family HTH domain